MGVVDDLKYRFNTGTIVQKLIYVNIAIFFIALLSNLFKTTAIELSFIDKWFALDSNFDKVIFKPWTIISYGFLHSGFIHLLFNMIALYFIGNLFIQYFTQKQLLNFYILGTLFGGLLFIVSQSYLPLFQDKNPSLVGASAGIYAILIGIATYMPNFEVNIRFIGFVKLKYIAYIFIGISLAGMIGANAGGNFAHLGGALFGFLYVNQASNKDISIWDNFLALFKRKQKPLRTVYKSKTRNKSTDNNNDANQQKIDAILDKISKSGYNALSKVEKEFLFKQGKK
jgi:membrane associated rhomboid family serine protease